MSDRPNQNGSFREDETSDLFSIRSYSSDANSIPTIQDVPLTKEEVQRKRLIRITVVIATIVAAVIVVALVLYFSHIAQVNDAVMAAGDDGRVATAQEALELLEGDDDDASNAIELRIRAMLLLAGEGESGDAIRAELDRLPEGEAEVDRERGIAGTYLALAAGELSMAMHDASHVVAEGDSAAEAARARALAARSVGNVEQALAAATIAAEQRPDSPRHVALFAELTARAGDADAALARLDSLAEEFRNGATQIARARIMDQSGAELAQVSGIAEAVLADAGSTNHEKAWARLLIARGAAAAGDRATARAQLDQAAEVAPPGDELFTLGLCEAALRIGAIHLAQQTAQGLPTPLSADAGRRAQLGAEIALSRHNLRDAEAHLEHAPDEARTSLGRARLLEARGQIEAARALYRTASEDTTQRVPATVYLAAMELTQDNAREAMDRIGPLLEQHPQHPDVVPVAVEAQLGLGRAADAMQLVLPALEAHPGDVRLLAAKAHVQMALEQWEEALGTLDAALGIEDDDADLHADRGRAAQRLSRREVAREAYDAALELSPSHPPALIGRLELDLLDFEPTQARQILGRIDEAEIQSLRIDRLRGRLLTMEIAGASGVRTLRRVLVQRDDDPELMMSFGWLHMQSEQYSNAVRTFSRLTDGEDPPVEAVMARALAQIRMRASNPARSAMESVTEDLDRESLDPTIRAQLHAMLGRLAWSDHDRPLAIREAGRAIALDRRNTEAHLILAEIAQDRDQDSTAEYAAALVGLTPSSRPLAMLSIREENVTDSSCAYADRYRRAAPQGQFARGVWRVQRDCRRRGSSGSPTPPDE